jgi:hypothetical protein
LKEDLHLATPAPNPSEIPIVNPNPLPTNPQPATAGTRLSLVNLDVRHVPPAFYKLPSAVSPPLNGLQASIEEHPSESQSSTGMRTSCDTGRVNSNDLAWISNAPAFGEGNTLLMQANHKDAGKRRKPKNNMTKSNSSFIMRVMVNDSLTRRLQDRPADGLFAFANINRGFQWLDLSSPSKVRPFVSADGM